MPEDVTEKYVNVYEIANVQEVNLIEHGYNTECKVFYVHIKINSIDNIAFVLIENFLSDSWVSGLMDEDDKISYWACAKPTIKYLVEDVLKEVAEKNEMTSKFGEYLISSTSQMSLEKYFNHDAFPIAELWKEQKSGNPGFDFHMHTHTDLLAYGEAKYSSTNSPCIVAIDQIIEMIDTEKDKREFTNLKRLNQKISSKHLDKENKAFISAFSLNAKNPITVLNNALAHEATHRLLDYPELYIIGVELCQ